MNLSEIKNSTRVAEVIWTCNLFAFGRLNKNIWSGAEQILYDLLDNLITLKETDITEKKIRDHFQKTVHLLEELLDQKPLDDGWIYEYGGLNCLFVEIMQALDFPVKRGKYYWESNFVYNKDFI